MIASNRTLRAAVALLGMVLCAAVCAADTRPSAVAASTAGDDYQMSFLRLLEAGDRLRIAAARGLETRTLRADYVAAYTRLRALPPPVPGTPALRAIADRLAEGALAPEHGRAVAEPACPAAFAATASADELQRGLYACYGRAAAALAVDGAPRDRLSLLHELALADDPARRRALHGALQPLFDSVTRDTNGANPFRLLQARTAANWRAGGSPIERNLAALGMAGADLEPWLESVLAAWRDLTAGADLEPWDYEYANNPVERTLGARAPRARFEAINAAFHASIGADPAALGIHFDLAPRAGKTAVAFTDFGARPARRADGSWSSGEPWVFASYASGGIGNLGELLHETGHAVHIASIRTEPAFADWPDSNALTEAIADIHALEVHEPAWQQRWLGAAAPLADNLKSRYGAIALDFAWALFELRVHADPAREPNAVWTDITVRYLHVRPHPELAWWARRGQLVESPGYMMNYALGAILAADLRQRTRAARGDLAAADPGRTDWLREQLFRFGREKGSAALLRDFLGRAPTPDALLEDMRRVR